MPDGETSESNAPRRRGRPTKSSRVTIAPTEKRYVDVVNKLRGVFDGPILSVLYVGANVRAFAFLDLLRDAGCSIDIVEAWKENVDALKPILRENENIVCADIRKIDLVSSFAGRHFDLAIWWHGPEHVESPEVRPVLEKLTKSAKHVLIGCPWGDYPQGDVDGNPFEQHRCPLNPKYFERKGFKVATLGEPVRGTEKQGGQIAAYK
jgi:hypothetical protein